MRRVVTLLLFLPVLLAAEDCAQGLSVVTPRVAVPGKSTAVLVTLHGASRRRPLNVTLRLVADKVEESPVILAETSQTLRGQGVIPLRIPSDASGSCILQTLVGSNSGLQASSRLRLSGPVRDVVLRADRRLYAPGDTVHFWLLALDHSLQMASDVIGEVSVRDPAGNKVALWPQLSLDRGVQSFSLPLSGAAPLGLWRIELEAADYSVPDGEGAAFWTDFNVTMQAATEAAAAAGVPEVAMAEEHFVELRFGHAMRRLYKPGLPFVGKVEAISTEKCVRVRVKVYDNTTAIYSQDIEITSGEAMFVVPAILADSDVITLQAELVSVEGKEIDSHYVLAREPIRKWNSSSDCYLLIQGLERTLQPEEHARVAVLSTCPCERDMHALVTTDGHVTYWSERAADSAPPGPEQRPPSARVDGAAICRFNFTFTIQAVMAPVSHLLVYYVTEDGEPISDVITFDVRLLQKQVSLSGEHKDFWLPGQALDVKVTAEPGSIVCLVGGRAGGGDVTRLPPTRLDINSSNPNARFRHDRRWSSASRDLDFLDAGVDFFQRQCSDKGTIVFHQETSREIEPADRKGRPGLVGEEGELDRLWLWKCFNHSGSTEQHTIAVPQDPGKWSLRALSLARGGLRFSRSLVVSVFRPLSVSFGLPASLRVGETVEVDVRIGNSANSCMDVTALLALTEGAHFLSSGLLYVTEKLRLGPHGATSLVVRVVVTSPGVKNMTAEVSGYGGESCSEPGNGSLAGSIMRSATTLVRPEGLRRTATDSAYFCANEKLIISAPEDFRLEWLPAPRNRAGLVFEARSARNALFVLSDGRYANERSYQVMLGDTTWIGRGSHGYGVRLVSVETSGLLSGEVFRTFWLSWDRGVLSLGKGPQLHAETLLTWRLDRKLKVSHLGLASGWGTPAEFRVWNYNEEAGFSQVLHLDVPRPVVPGSEQGSLTVSGGLALPTSAARWLDPAQHLLALGESSSLVTTLAAFSPLPVLDHATSHVVDPSSESNATSDAQAHAPADVLAAQLQALLVFRKADGSFGDHRYVGSHSGTVAALQVLTRAQSHVAVDADILSSAKRWLQLRQRPDGGFSPTPEDDVVGSGADDVSLGSDVEVTSETLAALLAVGMETEGDEESALRARYFLERSLFRVESPLAIAPMTYALLLARSDMAATAMTKLRNVSTNEEGDFGWPIVSSGLNAGDLLYEENSTPLPVIGGSRRQKDIPAATSAAEYKASLYALKTYTHLGDLKSAEPVARYLFYRSHLLDRHVELLYLAVEAFSQFGSLATDRHRALTVSLATSGMELTDTLELRHAGDSAQTRKLALPSLPTKVFVYATGAGCATVQGRVSYSTYSPSSHTKMLDLWAGVEGEATPSLGGGHNTLDELEGKLPILRLKTCFRWKAPKPSGVLRLEVTLFSGFRLLSWTPVIVDANGTRGDVHHGTRADKVWFVLRNVSSACPVCVRFSARGMFVINSLRPAFARVYPAARPHLAAEAFFHSPLLAGITDDDLVTWFGSSQQGGLQLGSNFSEVCECGEECPVEDNEEPKEAIDAQSPVVETATNVIVLSENNTSSSSTSVPSTITTVIVNESHTWSPTTSSSSSSSTTTTAEVGTPMVMSPPTTTEEPESVNIIITDEEEEEPQSPVVNSTIAPISKTAGFPKTVNKERSLAPTPPSTPAPFTPPASPTEREKLYVLDRDTLWGMLREVVHVELNNSNHFRHEDNTIGAD